MTKILSYKVIFEPADEGGYTAYVPSLPGCISEGNTYEEAVKNIKEAIKDGSRSPRSSAMRFHGAM